MRLIKKVQKGRKLVQLGEKDQKAGGSKEESWVLQAHSQSLRPVLVGVP